MPAPATPYITGPPVGGESGFFGRNDIIQDVERVLRYPTHNSVILYGQRRTGKTSLLLQLERRLPSPPFFTIYVDLLDKTMLSVSTVLHQMAAAAAEKAGMPPPVPTTFEDNPAAFHEGFLPALYQKLGMQLQPIFLLDEFETVDIPETDLPESSAIRNLDTYLYRLLATQTHTDFIFAAGRRMKELSDVEQSTFQPDLRRFVSMLSPDDARALILQPGSPAFTDEAVERIIETTRGHPYFTQLLCQALTTRRPAPKQPITKDDVKAVLPELLAQGDTGLAAIWDSIPPAEHLTLAAAATRSTGPLDVVSRAAIDGVLTQEEVPLSAPGLAQAPKNLVDWQVWEQTGRGYNFFTEFFRQWVAQNRPLAQIKVDELARLSGKAPLPSAAARPEPPPRQPAPAARPDGLRRWWPLAAVLAFLLLVLLCAWLINPGLFSPIPPTATAIAELIETAESPPTGTPAAAAVATETPAEPRETASPTPSKVATGSRSSPTVAATATPPSPILTPAPSMQQIRVAGAVEMEPVLEQVALAFRAEQPNVEVLVSGGGVQAGLEALQQDSAGLTMVNRQLTPAEQAALGNPPVFSLPQRDPIAIITHPGLPVSDLTPEQVRDIFSGAITNWSEVGGPNAPIVPVTREASADIRLAFEQQILGPDTSLAEANAIVVSSDEAVRATVATTPYAIGFVPVGGESPPPQLNENWAVVDAMLLEAKSLTLNQAAPTNQNAESGTYPLARPLNLVATAPVDPAIQAWIDFVLSPQGQQIIKDFRQNAP